MRRRVVVRRGGVGLLGAAAIGGTAYMLGSRKKGQEAQQYTQPQSHAVSEPIAMQGYQAPAQSAQSSPPETTPISQDTKITQLKELGKLKKSGVLTTEEFENEKRKILDQ